MKGYLKLEAINTSEDMQGLSVACEMEDVGLMDKLQILRAVCMALKVDHETVKLFVTLDKAGVLKPAKEDIQCDERKSVDFDDDDDYVEALLEALFGGMRNEG